MKLSKTILAVLGTAVLGLMSQSAQAVPITGSIGFNGSGFGSQSGNQSTLTFNNPMFVDQRTGTYLAIAAGTTANFAPIVWTGSGTNAMLISNNSPQWTITTGGNTYSFNLLSLTSATLNNGAVSLQGTGIAFATGFEPTFATFSVQGTGNNFQFEIIQSSTTTNPNQRVPDGGSAIALLGMGVMGLEVLRRKFRRA